MPQEPEETATLPPAPGRAPSGDLARRGLLLGAGAVGVAGLTAACGGGSGSDEAKPSSAPSSAPNDGGLVESSGGGVVLGSAADVPVGGGKVYKDRKIVVTQPKAGEYHAFTAVCTHRGCTVGAVVSGLITCPCHGSAFHIETGTVARPPAARALVEQAIKIADGKIILV
ncbi:hypothetical protein DZF91_06425 [Actinomadura logoneensis]|uniref:Cytochrome bc1 complex Rieske iron-sulfur subunit n=1 Tax=Actinomadura logoneensis TaxID=2293572 RepID=A0A372JRS8_9ACTN|nr:Rieske (2Fe-2S) protein [Actinomadura logoneensis]RFU42474.1 hypothetical protein DZF91_06425 [Actinomadura logoneensis]